MHVTEAMKGILAALSDIGSYKTNVDSILRCGIPYKDLHQCAQAREKELDTDEKEKEVEKKKKRQKRKKELRLTFSILCEKNINISIHQLYYIWAYDERTSNRAIGGLFDADITQTQTQFTTVERERSYMDSQHQNSKCCHSSFSFRYNAHICNGCIWQQSDERFIVSALRTRQKKKKKKNDDYTFRSIVTSQVSNWLRINKCAEMLYVKAIPNIYIEKIAKFTLLHMFDLAKHFHVWFKRISVCSHSFFFFFFFSFSVSLFSELFPVSLNS